MLQNELLKFSRMLKSECFRIQICKPKNAIVPQKREISFLLEWFNRVFNAVDQERITLVGPDLACAEWLLRNGASVRFKGHPEILSDYNNLMALEEIPNLKSLKVEEVYAKNADLNARGFDHFKDCGYVNKISFIFCNRVNDSALFKLKFVKDTLQYLEVTSCFNVKDQGIKSLAQLRNLTVLTLSDLVSVKNAEECEAELIKALPNCKIDFKM